MQYTKIVETIFTQLQGRHEEIIFDVSSKRWISWDELYKKISSLQSYFMQSWLNKWDIVVIFLKDQIDFLAILMAAISLGWLVAIVEPTMWKSVLDQKIKLLQPKYVFLEWIVHDIFKMDFLWIWEKYILKNIPKSIYTISDHLVVWKKSIVSQKTAKLDRIYSKEGKINIWIRKTEESDAALIVFTWGTTSDPKWVIHTHESLLYTITEIRKIVGKYEVFYADLFHFSLLWIASWSKVILWDENYNTRKIEKVFSKHAINCSFFAPYKLQKFIDDKIIFPWSMHCLISWSAPVYTSFLQKLYAHIWDDIKVLCLYGMTEILPIAYIDWKEKLQVHSLHWDVLWKPLSSISYECKDSELIVSGKHSSLQYIWKKQSTHISTWDLVKKQDGYFVMIGRKKDMILRGNYNIYPWVYEPIISSIPWVKECSMFWIQESDTNESIVLLIDREKSYSREDIYKLLQKWEYSIDSYALPQHILFWAIPKYWRQKKVHKKKLSQLYSQKIKWK